MTLLARWYARRIVNINVNIVLAGAMALVPVAIAVELVHRYAFGNAPDLTLWERKVINGVTLVTDIVADVTFFYLLHWLANHWPRKVPGRRAAEVAGAHAAPGYFKDATLVQMERMVLSPLLYGIWLGTQSALIIHGVSPTWATVWGFCSATVCIRSLHTLWMLRSARRARRVAAIRTAPGQTDAPAPAPPAQPL